jgi:uncharacterized protein
MTRKYTILRDVVVPMHDGVGLATDVYLPDGSGPFPALLQRTPYDKSAPFGTQFIVGMDIVRALDAGFGIVIQDTRGRFASSGEFDPFVHEGSDGVDTVAWIRDQDFSNGQIASYGASYVGATQMVLAMHGADGHVAMAPFLTTGDYHDQWTYRGGALQLGFIYLWIIESLGPIDVEKRQLAGEHPARQMLSELRSDPVAAMERLPVLADDIVALAPYLKDWLGSPTADGWWSEVRPLDHVEAIRTPALHIAGFNDIFVDGSIKSYDMLRRHGANSAVRDAQYLVIGPWSHGNIGDWQGDEWLGYSAAGSELNLTDLQLGFFSAIVHRRQPDIPRVTYFTSGINQWQTAEEWPPPSAVQALYLAGDQALTAAPDDTAGADRYMSNSLDPVRTVGGASFLPGLLVAKNSGPMDQSLVEARDDVLVYRGSVLDSPTEVTGLVTLELWSSSSATDCDWTARLVDVHPNGRALGIVDGILRARYRRGAAEPLTPGEPELFTIELGNISHVFGAGHRIGLQIASSNFPRFDRNPQQMIDPVTAKAEDFVVAQQTVFRGGGRSSRLMLPVVA